MIKFSEECVSRPVLFRCLGDNQMPDMGVLVFKTSVDDQDHVDKLRPMLNTLAGDGKWNFALDDCDRVLRIVSNQVRADEAILLLRLSGFQCDELE